MPVPDVAGVGPAWCVVVITVAVRIIIRSAVTIVRCADADPESSRAGIYADLRHGQHCGGGEKARLRRQVQGRVSSLSFSFASSVHPLARKTTKARAWFRRFCAAPGRIIFVKPRNKLFAVLEPGKKAAPDCGAASSKLCKRAGAARSEDRRERPVKSARNHHCGRQRQHPSERDVAHRR